MTTRRQEKRQSNLLIRLLLVVVFTGGYLALAVLDRGGIGALFAQPALIALTVVLVALCGTALLDRPHVRSRWGWPAGLGPSGDRRVAQPNPLTVQTA